MTALMREISLPKTFTLGVDGQFTPFSPDNDQVWSLTLEETHHSPFSLQTTYGLSAVSMRLFPDFIKNNQHLLDANHLSHSPKIAVYTPGYLCLNLDANPFEIQFDFFIPEPEVLVGSIQIENTSDDLVEITVELAAILVPMGKGSPTKAEKEGVHHILSGTTDGLNPVLLMSGGPTGVNNPFPALSLPIKIPPHQIEEISWVMVTKPSKSASFSKAQSILASDWQSKAYEQKIRNERNFILIHTGNPDWDAAFSFAQPIALTHLVKSSHAKEEPTFLRVRLPDSAANRRKNIEELDDLTTLEAHHLAQVLLPAHSAILKKLVQKYLSRLEEDHTLLSRFNRSPFLRTFPEPPLLAHLSWELFKIDQDKHFLISIYPKLSHMIDAWLKPDSEMENLELPTWQNTAQLHLESGLFTFDRWGETAQGVDIQNVISPALISMLISETKAISKISAILENEDAQDNYQTLSTHLEQSLSNLWDEDTQKYQYADRESLLFPTQERLYSNPVQSTIEINKAFHEPQRILCHIYANTEKTRACVIRFVGTDIEGNPIVEEVQSHQVRWIMSVAHLNSQNLFRVLDTVTIEGLDHHDQIVIETVALSQPDVTCLLPLWSGGGDPEHIKTLAESHIEPAQENFTTGIPEVWQGENELPENLPVFINVIWNTLIIEGLLNRGYIILARDYFTNLMNTMTQGLEVYQGFFNAYEQVGQRPAGQQNVIGGLPPIKLFLKIAGIALFSPERVAIWGENPFPWPIEVHWQGLSIRRQDSHTLITFPNGAFYESHSTEPMLLSPQTS